MPDSFVETIGRLRREKRRARMTHMRFLRLALVPTIRNNEKRATGGVWPPQGHKTLMEVVAGLPEEWAEAWEERAAIMQHDGGLTPDEADRLAYEQVRAAMSETQ